jgi:hypothetical protein
MWSVTLTLSSVRVLNRLFCSTLYQTNDARDVGSGGPENWPTSCNTATAGTLGDCNFATDYRALLEVIKEQGPSPTQPPEVYMMIPPALMQQGAYGMNQTIINTIFPKLVPLIASANADIVKGTIDV